MKRSIIAVSLSLILILTVFVIAYADSGRLATAVQTSSGGTLGKCTGAGYMTWNNSASAGADSTTASTSSNARGSLQVTARIYYADSAGSKSRSSYNSTKTNLNVQTSVTVPAGAHGTRSDSYHSYSSEEYGSWSASLSKTY